MPSFRESRLLVGSSGSRNGVAGSTGRITPAAPAAMNRKPDISHNRMLIYHTRSLVVNNNSQNQLANNKFLCYNMQQLPVMKKLCQYLGEFKWKNNENRRSY